MDLSACCVGEATSVGASVAAPASSMLGGTIAGTLSCERQWHWQPLTGQTALVANHSVIWATCPPCVQDYRSGNVTCQPTWHHANQLSNGAGRPTTERLWVCAISAKSKTDLGWDAAQGEKTDRTARQLSATATTCREAGSMHENDT